jgi:ribosomal protein L11 methyltransferase
VNQGGAVMVTDSTFSFQQIFMNTSASYFNFTFNCNESIQDIAIALLNEIGFDGFVQEQNKLEAFIECEKYSNEILIQQLNSVELATGALLPYTFIKIESQNWNETWEMNFEPIIIDNLVYVKASFHAELPNIKHTITIQPKMSFGTGHHSTTYLMMQQMLNENFDNKLVMDMGSGTGILAILAEKLGAIIIKAIDNDEWAYTNAVEMVAINGCSKIEVILGNEQNIGNLTYNIILSNITKNFNLQNLRHYNKVTEVDSLVFLSGFYEADVAEIIAEAKKYDFIMEDTKVQKDWAVVKLRRI